VISILIPIYNCDARKLVKELHQLCEKAGIVYEILAFDDHSDEVFRKLNVSISQVSHAVYKVLPENMGRSKIRNLLAKEAQYPNLIFVDCDMMVDSDQFIKNYLNVSENASVIYGGLTYADQPKDKNKSLRWKYGIEREALTAKEREIKPYISIKTCNLWIKKEVFEQVIFNETLTQYGYEDTLFGIELQQKNISVMHIDNPLIHCGLEDNDIYLEKTKTAMQNLKSLMKNKDLKNHLSKMKIVEYYNFEKKLGLYKVTLLNYQTFGSVILTNLKSKNPNLKLFDLYKLVYLYRAK
jgi:glycosyltransferase involved in cell wall biosynthesis